MNNVQTQPQRIAINHISENAILLEWPEKMCEKQHQHIMHCQTKIEQTLASNLIESIVSYASLIIYYRFEWFIHKYGADAQYAIDKVLRNIVEQPLVKNINSINNHSAASSIDNVIEIPVYYGKDSGWDLKEVAQRTHLSIAEVIEKHTQKTYRAFALGFTPGFCYLGQLPAELQLARKSSPRLFVPKGAVAIAGEQTAIYPNASPGGWHILGQTPTVMTSISPTQDDAFKSTINVGQNVKFIAISKNEFLALGGDLHPENNNDFAKNKANR